MTQEFRSRLRIAFYAVLMGFIFYTYEYLLRITPSVMQTELINNFNINATLFGALSAYYYYSYTPMQLFVGVIVDKYPIKKVLFFATIVCAIGTIAIAYSNSYAIACCGRFLQGLGSAFAWVGILKLGALYLPKRFYGFVSGFGSVFGFLGAAVGQMTMGYVVQASGWRVLLEFLALGGIPLAVIIYLVINNVDKKLNINEVSVNRVSLYGWYLRLRLVMRSSYIWIAGIIAALLFLPTTVFAELWGITYMKNVYGFDNAEASFIISMIFIGWAIGSLLIGMVSLFIESKVKLIRYGSILALGASLLMLYKTDLDFNLLCLVCLAFGIFSAVEILTFAMGCEVYSPKIAGIAGAFVNFLCMLSGVFCQKLAGQMLDWFSTGPKDLQSHMIYSINDYKKAVIIIPVSLALSFVLTFIIDEKNKKLIFTKK